MEGSTRPAKTMSTQREASVVDRKTQAHLTTPINKAMGGGGSSVQALHNNPRSSILPMYSPDDEDQDHLLKNPPWLNKLFNFITCPRFQPQPTRPCSPDVRTCSQTTICCVPSNFESLRLLRATFKRVTNTRGTAGIGTLAPERRIPGRIFSG